MDRLCVWLALTPLALAACGEDATCPPGGFAAVSVHALSAVDATPVLGARGVVREGGYADSLRELSQGYYEAAQDRPGTYAVHLEHAGFAAWDTSDVVVLSPGGSCPLIETTQVEARLAPL